MFVIAYGFIIDSKYIEYIKNHLSQISIFENNLKKHILLVYNQKYIIRDDSTEIDLNKITLAVDEIKYLKTNLDPNSQLKLYSFNFDQKFLAPKFKIITFNLGTNIQSNIAKGSEAILVKKCQNAYKSTNGLSNLHVNNLTLSQCTLNAINWLKTQNADLIGLQEINPDYSELIKNQFSDNYDYIGNRSVYFIYDKSKLGLAQILSSENLYISSPWRPIIVVWFEKVKMLAINLHAEHNINLKNTIENAINSLNLTVNPERIIVTGDFNDAYGENIKKLNILGKNVEQLGEPAYSCCEDSDYRYLGDYIFDSNKYSNKYSNFYYGIPKELNQLMSDHKPVILYEY